MNVCERLASIIPSCKVNYEKVKDDMLAVFKNKGSPADLCAIFNPCQVSLKDVEAIAKADGDHLKFKD